MKSTHFVAHKLAAKVSFAFALLICLVSLVGETHAQLRIIAPNGGERFPVGSRTTIRWTGIPSTDTVTIEYSYNSGSSWNLITDRGTGLQHTWLNIPNTISDFCLLRITAKSEGTTTDSVLHFSSFINSVFHQVFYSEFSPDGSKIIAASQEGNVFIWDSHTKLLLHNIPVETTTNRTGTALGNVRYNPNGTLFAACSPIENDDGQIIRIYDAITGLKRDEWKLEGINITDHAVVERCAWSPDGTKLLVCAQGWGVIYDVASKTELTRLHGYTDSSSNGSGGWNISYGNMLDGCWTQDGQRIIGLRVNPGPRDNVYNNAITGDTIRTRHVFNTSFLLNQSIRMKPDESEYIMTSSDSTLRIFDLVTGTRQFMDTPYTVRPTWAEYDRTGSRYLTTGADTSGSFSRHALKVWDANSKSLIRAYPQIGGAMTSGQFSPDNRRILVACSDGPRIYQDPETTTGETAISQAFWSIVANTGANVNVYIPDRSGYVGDVIEAPVIIDDAGSAFAAGATEISLNVSFNSTMLAPVDATPKGTIANGRRTIPLTLELDPEDSILTVLRFLVALGNDSVTFFQITDLTPNNATVTASSIDGRFSTLGICLEGGPRLVNPDSEVQMTIERSSLSHIRIKLRTIEDGATSVIVTDPFGRRIYDVLNENITAGERILPVDLGSLSTGKYFIVLQTPTIHQVKQFEVIR